MSDNSTFDIIIFGVQEEVLPYMDAIARELRSKTCSVQVQSIPKIDLKNVSPGIFPKCRRYLYVSDKESVPRISAESGVLAKFDRSLVIVRIIESSRTHRVIERDECAVLDNSHEVIVFDNSLTLEQLDKITLPLDSLSHLNTRPSALTSLRPLHLRAGVGETQASSLPTSYHTSFYFNTYTFLVIIILLLNTGLLTFMLIQTQRKGYNQ